MIRWGLLLSFCILGVHSDISEKLRNGYRGPTHSGQYPGLQAPFESGGGLLGAEQRAVPTAVTKGPHDEDNLERLCNDPFHDFLCKPVGPRKYRIDGNLRPQAVIPPGVLERASSNVRESKIPPNQSGSALLPSELEPEGYQYPKPTNIFENRLPTNNNREYLPPPPPSNQRFPAPTNVNKEYLPPFQQVTTTTFRPYPTQQFNIPAQSAQNPFYIPPSKSGSSLSGNSLSPSTLPPRQYFSVTPSTTPIPETPNPFLDIRFSPASTNLEPNIAGGALLPTSLDNEPSNNKKEADLCKDSFHSFLCEPLKPRKRIDGRIRPQAKIPSNALIPESSFNRETKTLPEQQSGGALLPTSLENDGYNYPKPSSANQIFASVQPSGDTGYQYPKPSTTPKPITTVGYTYPKPVPSLTPSSSNIDSSINGYNYRKPSQTFNLPQSTPSPIIGAPSNTNSILEPNKQNFQSSFQQVTTKKPGYTYPKPTTPFPSPSPTFVQTTFSTTVKPTEGYNYQKPIFVPFQTSQATNNQEKVASNGYTYPKPPRPFALPQATNTQQQIIQTGYLYPVPKITFPVPQPTFIQYSTVNVPLPSPVPSFIPIIAPQATNLNSIGYSYPQPPPTLQLTPQPAPSNVQEQSGYAYPKPNQSFPLPGDKTPAGTNQLDTKGYDYPKPRVQFNLPNSVRFGGSTTPLPPTSQAAVSPSLSSANVISEHFFNQQHQNNFGDLPPATQFEILKVKRKS